MKIMQKKGEAEQILEIWFQIWNLRKKLEKKHLFPQCIIFIFYLNRKAALCSEGITSSPIDAKGPKAHSDVSSWWANNNYINW